MSGDSSSGNLSQPLYEGMVKSMEQESKVKEATEINSSVERGKGKNRKKDKHSEQNAVSTILLLLFLSQVYRSRKGSMA